MDYAGVAMELRELGQPRSSHIDRRDRGNSERKRQIGIKSLVDDDLDRHPLHDLDEIAGRVLGRKSGEFRTRSQLNAIYMTPKVEVRIGVEVDGHGLTRAHSVELAFLEIRGDPNLRRDDRKNLLARGHVIAHFDIALGDPAVLGRGHDRPGEIQQRLIEPGLGLLDLAFELADLRIRLPDLLRNRLRLRDLGLGLQYLRLRLAQSRGGGIDLLLSRGCLGKTALAPVIGLRLGLHGLRRGELRLRLLQKGGEVLARDLSPELLTGELVLRHIERALRGIAVKFKLTRIDMDERLPLMDELIVRHVERNDLPRDSRRYGYRPPVRISIVGRFNIAG